MLLLINHLTCSSIIYRSLNPLNTLHIYDVYFCLKSYLLNLLFKNLSDSPNDPRINHTSALHQPCISQASTNLTTYRLTTNTLWTLPFQAVISSAFGAISIMHTSDIHQTCISQVFYLILRALMKFCIFKAFFRIQLMLHSAAISLTSIN